ncbi:helix-turn-helix transcriptional regulator [bacterium]|nr:helix-turn-helix transcriptional regulator [bacterium]
MSQAELARRVGTSRQQVYDWERQRSRPGLEHLVKLAAALGCTVDNLIGAQTAAQAEGSG